MAIRDQKPLITRSNRASVATVSSQPLPFLHLIFIVNDKREKEQEHNGSIKLSRTIVKSAQFLFFFFF